jgi:tRNA(Ile)-lysidine synthetase-like protein
LDPKIVEHICRSAGYLREVSSGIVHKVEPVRKKPEEPRMPEEPSNGGYSLEVSEAVGYEVLPVEIGKLPACAWFDAESLKGRTIELRKWRDGDWMRPCGFPHRKKLQDIFVTAKTPPSVRRSLPVVADAETGEVLWIPGCRVSESVKVPSMSVPSVKLCLICGTL